MIALQPVGVIAEEHIHKIPERFPEVTVEKYGIMPDHIHLLLGIREGEQATPPILGNVIGWYKYQVAKQVNVRWERAGVKVFQRSYYDHVIRNRKDYNAVWQYIENNPQKWVMTHSK